MNECWVGLLPLLLVEFAPAPSACGWVGNGGKTSLRVCSRRVPSGTLASAGAREGRSHRGLGGAKGGDRGGAGWGGAGTGRDKSGDWAGLRRKLLDAGRRQWCRGTHSRQ